MKRNGTGGCPVQPPVSVRASLRRSRGPSFPSDKAESRETDAQQSERSRFRHGCAATVPRRGRSEGDVVEGDIVRHPHEIDGAGRSREGDATGAQAQLVPWGSPEQLVPSAVSGRVARMLPAAFRPS